MRILLTSTGLSSQKVINDVKELADKPIENNKVLFITTASEVEKDKDYVQWDYQDLQKAGFKQIDFSSIDDNTSLNNYDILYVCGGNTFYLLDEIRKNKFDKKIAEFINSNKFYIGCSAGSIILSNTVETALKFDKNIAKIKDYSALKIIDGIIIPHANNKADYINEIRTKYQNITLIDDDDDKIIKEA